MSARWSPAAEEDLQAVVAYLLEHADVAAAESFLDEVDRAIGLLVDGRFEGAEVRLRTGEVCRAWPLTRHRLYYQRRDDRVVVLRLYDARRRPLPS